MVGDTGNNRLVRFTYRDKTVSGGSAIKIPEVSAPSRVQLDSKGEIYALDAKERRIVHLGPEGEFKGVLTLEGAPPPATFFPKTYARFCHLIARDRPYLLEGMVDEDFGAMSVTVDEVRVFGEGVPPPAREPVEDQPAAVSAPGSSSRLRATANPSS